jgi:hypothetical protein
MARAGAGQPGVEAGLRRDDAHVSGGRFRDHAGDLIAVPLEGHPDRIRVVVGKHQRRLGDRYRHAGAARDAASHHSGARRREQRVDVTVVAAGELDHQLPAGGGARQADRRHGGLGTGGDQPDLVDRRTRDDLLGEVDLRPRRGAVGRAPVNRLGDLGDHRRVRVPEQQRPPRADQVHVGAAVGVDEVGAGAADHEPRHAPDGAEGAHR